MQITDLPTIKTPLYLLVADNETCSIEQTGYHISLAGRVVCLLNVLDTKAIGVEYKETSEFEIKTFGVSSNESR